MRELTSDELKQIAGGLIPTFDVLSFTTLDEWIQASALIGAAIYIPTAYLVGYKAVSAYGEEEPIDFKTFVKGTLITMEDFAKWGIRAWAVTAGFSLLKAVYQSGFR